jgi:hypothetical protein
MTLEDAMFYETENVVLNACSFKEINENINSIYAFNVRRFLWNNTARGTFYNVNDFLQAKFFEDNLYS